MFSKNYFLNDSPNIVLVDVDETLISFSLAGRENEVIEIKNNGFTEYVVPLHKQINLVMSLKKRGYYVRVHSQSGEEWASAVVEAVGLEKYVDSIETKPKFYVDDLNADAWMKIIPSEEN